MAAGSRARSLGAQQASPALACECNVYPALASEVQKRTYPAVYYVCEENPPYSP